MNHNLHKSILLVDDDDVFRNRLAKAFQKRGFTVETAAHGAEAIIILSRLSPVFAVLDLRMPGITGLDLVKEMKNLSPRTKILVLTGYGSIATAVEAIRLGAAHYLTKPADADEILAVLEKDEIPTDSNEEVPSLARVEWEHINRVLTECEGNISKAARLLGLHRRSLQRKLSKFPVAR